MKSGAFCFLRVFSSARKIIKPARSEYKSSMKKISFIFLIVLVFSAVCLGGCTGGGNPIENALANSFVTIEAKVENGSVFCKTTVNFYNCSENEIKSIPFAIYSQTNANGDVRGAEILDVSQNGNKLKYRISEGKASLKPTSDSACTAYALETELDESVYPNERAELVIQSVAPFDRSADGQGGEKTEVFLSRFYPVLLSLGENGFYEFCQSEICDALFSEVAFITLKLEVSGEYSVLCGGECTRTEVGEKTTVYTYKLDNFTEVCVLLSKGCEVFSEEKNGVRYTCFYDRNTDYADLLNDLQAYVEFFSEKTKCIPFKSLAFAITGETEQICSFPRFVLAPKEQNTGDENGDTARQLFKAAGEQWFKYAARFSVSDYPCLTGGIIKTYEYSYLSHLNPAKATAVRQTDLAEFCAFYGANADFTDANLYLKPLSGCASLKELSAGECGLAALTDQAVSAAGESKFDTAVAKFFAKRAYCISIPQEIINYLTEVFPQAESLF